MKNHEGERDFIEENLLLNKKNRPCSHWQKKTLKITLNFFVVVIFDMYSQKKSLKKVV